MTRNLRSRMANRINLRLLAPALVCALWATGASATVIGPGSGIGGATGVDDGTFDGVRLNIDRNNSMMLDAGTYNVLEASFNFAGASSGEAGDLGVIPFLAVQTADGGPALAFQTLWVGDLIVPGSDGIETTAYGPGSEILVLAVATKVFAGFWQDDPLVNFANGGATAHDNSPITPSAAGETLADFSHPDLGPIHPGARTYAYHIKVASVPEPAALALLGIALIGFGLLRRRNLARI